MSITIFCKFWRIFCYCIPNSKVYKKTLVKFLKNGKKLCTKYILPTKLFFVVLYLLQSDKTGFVLLP